MKGIAPLGSMTIASVAPAMAACGDIAKLPNAADTGTAAHDRATESLDAADDQ